MRVSDKVGVGELEMDISGVVGKKRVGKFDDRSTNLGAKGRKKKKILSFEQKVQIKALRDLGVKRDRVKAMAGITNQTVLNAIASLKKDDKLSPAQRNFLDRWESTKLKMADDMAALAEFIYSTITIGDIQKCSLPQKVTSMAILQDKALLMRGDVTQRVAFEGLSDEQLKKIINGEQVVLDAELGDNP